MPTNSDDHDDLIGQGGAHGGPREPAEGLSSRPTFRDAAEALVAGKISQPVKGYDEYHAADPAERGWDLGWC